MMISTLHSSRTIPGPHLISYPIHKCYDIYMRYRGVWITNDRRIGLSVRWLVYHAHFV